MAILGIIIIFAGVVSLFEVLGIPLGISWEMLWPSILVIIGVYHIVRDRRVNVVSGGAFLFGSWLLLIEFNIVTGTMIRLGWPIILILMGLLLILRTPKSVSYPSDIGKGVKNSEGILNYTAIFTGVEGKVVTEDFNGADIVSIFGGAEIDLSKAGMKQKEIRVSATAVFGGIEITVPEDCNIVVRTTAIFGGVSNQSNTGYDENKNTIIVEGNAVFGGIDIKNKK